MILRRGNLWDQPADVYVFTGNSTIKKNGALVMGRGAALQARDQFPGCDLAFGREIREFEASPGTGEPYGLLQHPTLDPILTVFQVKNFFRDDADLDIIRHSVAALTYAAAHEWAGKRIVMNFPGIGAGHLQRSDVLPLLHSLPDNVSVWEYV